MQAYRALSPPLTSPSNCSPGAENVKSTKQGLALLSHLKMHEENLDQASNHVRRPSARDSLQLPLASPFSLLAMRSSQRLALVCGLVLASVGTLFYLVSGLSSFQVLPTSLANGAGAAAGVPPVSPHSPTAAIPAAPARPAKPNLHMLFPATHFDRGVSLWSMRSSVSLSRSREGADREGANARTGMQDTSYGPPPRLRPCCHQLWQQGQRRRGEAD